MGLEARCVAHLDGVRGEVRAHCGDGALSVRGPIRVDAPWATLTDVAAEGGVLRVVTSDGGVLLLALGDAAAAWAHAIRNPRPLLDKLGVRPGQAWALVGPLPDDFREDLTRHAGPASPGPDLSWVFLYLDHVDALPALGEARARLAPTGAVWAVWPKGRKALTEDHIRAWAKENGLVDVKVARFSDTLSALKLVIPVALRGR